MLQGSLKVYLVEEKSVKELGTMCEGLTGELVLAADLSEDASVRITPKEFRQRLPPVH